ncbi:hypothetical protein JW835_10570 [bacterium]|nr:hypothetical protein [bacterium]
MATITANAWKDMFMEIGLSENDMNRWHQVFEKRHPELHQDFLEWLHLSNADVQKIRQGAGQ